jgi:hypothetical protein
MCCSACPTCSSSTATRVFYAVIFFLASLVAWLMLVPSVANQLRQMSKYTGTVSCNDTDEKCKEEWGVLGIDRVFFGVALFHAFLALLMIAVKSSRDPRAIVQNGLWPLKLLAMIGIIVGAFFIPNNFYITWGWFGLVGAFLFMLVQLILLVDFAHSWNERWLQRLEDGQNCYKWVLLAVSIGMYIAVITITVLCFVFYAGHGCQLSQFFVALNLILCIAVTVASIHPRVQERMPTSGILQSGVVSFYTTYLIWSAVSGMPGHCSNGPSSSEAATVIGALLTFISVAYSSIRTSSASQLGQLGLTHPEEQNLLLPSSKTDVDDEDEEHPRKIIDNEKEAVGYSWSFFHLTFLFASFYMMEVLTDWAVVKDGDMASVQIGQGHASVWVKVVSSWIAVLLYLWTMIAPAIFTDRDFGPTVRN